MLVRPDNRQLIALASMTQQSRWRDIDELLTAEINKVVDLMIEQIDPSKLHECRGRIKALRDFQSEAREASKTLEKLGVKNPL